MGVQPGGLLIAQNCHLALRGGGQERVNDWEAVSASLRQQGAEAIYNKLDQERVSLVRSQTERVPWLGVLTR